MQLKQENSANEYSNAAKSHDPHNYQSENKKFISLLSKPIKERKVVVVGTGPRWIYD